MCLQCCNSVGPSSKNTAPKNPGAVHNHGKQRSSRGAGCSRRWISVQRPSQRRKEIRRVVSYQRQLLNAVVICWATAKQSLFALLDVNNSGTDGSWEGDGVGGVWRGEGLTEDLFLSMSRRTKSSSLSWLVPLELLWYLNPPPCKGLSWAFNFESSHHSLVTHIWCEHLSSSKSQGKGVCKSCFPYSSSLEPLQV